MYSFFQKLIEQGLAPVSNDVSCSCFLLIQKRVLDLIEKLHQICYSNILKIALKNHFIFSSLSSSLYMKLATTRLNPSLLKLMAYTN